MPRRPALVVQSQPSQDAFLQLIEKFLRLYKSDPEQALGFKPLLDAALAAGAEERRRTLRFAKPRPAIAALDPDQ